MGYNSPPMQQTAPILTLSLLIAAVSLCSLSFAEQGPSAANAPGASISDSHDVQDQLSRKAFLERARRYTRGNYLLYLLDTVWVAVVLGAMAFTGAANAAWNRIKSSAGEGARGKMLFIAAFVLILSAATMPIDYYGGFVRENAYGFSTQTAEGWFVDRVTGLGLSIVIIAMFVIPLYGIIRLKPRRWWIPGACLTGLFATIAVLTTPVIIDPLFNKFTPLPDQALRSTILEQAGRHGIQADDVYMMDASSRSIHDNAYVSGLLGTQRIVLYDTLLSNYADDEISFIMSHEIGHYVRHHLWLGLGMSLALITVVFWILSRVFRWVVGRFSRWTGYSDPSELSTLPLLGLIGSLVLFLTLPIQAAGSRWIERDADRFALENSGDSSAGARAFKKMALRNLSDPTPPAWIKWLLYSHPPIGERIARAEEAAGHDPAAGPLPESFHAGEGRSE
jgi:STE24 endopeptidase